MEEKLNTILSNPQLMQQIMSMAQSLGTAAPEAVATPKAEPEPQSAGLDLGMLQKLSGLAGQGAIDQEQRQLLRALSPYLSKDRISKLENAMRAAKMAKLASAFLGSGGLQALSGR